MAAKFYIDAAQEHPQELKYLLAVFGQSIGTGVVFTDLPVNAIQIRASQRFNEMVVKRTSLSIGDTGFIETDNGRPDYMATAFYMLNCLQEYNAEDLDSLGRYPNINSYQGRLKNSKENIVQLCFEMMAPEYNQNPVKRKTRFFLTHDIDTVHGAILEDGFNVLKKGRFDLFFQMLFRVVMSKPDWLNIDKIMKLESEYDCRSVFYWIVNKGRLNKREINADYHFNSKAIQKQVQLVKRNGFENGLHKSISKDTFQEEIKKFGGLPLGNRYHYLKYKLPDAFYALEMSGIKLDASLGFAEEAGFRNNYGLPFNPYDFKNKKPFTFVEVPLHIMDRTFYQYKKKSADDAENEIIEFFERNRENCVLSVLWHNNFFTNYKFKGYLNLYKRILSYIKENNFSTISQQEIIDQYSL